MKSRVFYDGGGILSIRSEGLWRARQMLGATPDHFSKAWVKAAGSEKSSAAEICTREISVSAKSCCATSKRTWSAMVLYPVPRVYRWRARVRRFMEKRS